MLDHQHPGLHSADNSQLNVTSSQRTSMHGAEINAVSGALAHVHKQSKFTMNMHPVLEEVTAEEEVKDS